ncbi:hypothetical protein C7N43_15570 [Sphingobacteriales bacterium UPWRP_1]|nr:hypothetical protein C7N43_15570 [Sphingobacteriales bacterium UPWRP_1]
MKTLTKCRAFFCNQKNQFYQFCTKIDQFCTKIDQLEHFSFFLGFLIYFWRAPNQLVPIVGRHNFLTRLSKRPPERAASFFVVFFLRVD